jgi:hypothetical protein
MKFKEFYELITEVADSKRNRESLGAAYGLTDAGAAEVIKQWNDVVQYVDKSHDYFQVPSGKKYDARDIYSWSRVSKDLGYDEEEAYSNLNAMIVNLSRQKETTISRRKEEKDYDLVYPTSEMISSGHFPHGSLPEEEPTAYVYIPKKTGASCKLGANTRWCTAATKGKNHFDEYNDKGITLFYILPKHDDREHFDGNNGGKIGVALWPNGREIQVFDEMDKNISWEDFTDIAEIRGIPRDKQFYAQWKGSIIKYLKYSADYALSVLTGKTQQEGEDEEWEGDLLNGLYEIAYDAASDDKESGEYVKYRKTGEHLDDAFQLEVFSKPSLAFYTDRVTNPPGIFDTANDMFQQEIVRQFNRNTYLTNQLMSNIPGEEWHENLNEIDDIDNKINFTSYDTQEALEEYANLRRYISIHKSDDWADLEKAILKQVDVRIQFRDHAAKENWDSAARGQRGSGDRIDSIKDWVKLIIDIKGRWDEFEKLMHSKIKSNLMKLPKGAGPWKGDHSGEYASRSSLMRLTQWYNNIVNRLKGHGRWEEFFAYLPESMPHLVKYHNGEWIEDDLPLTTTAQSNIDWKKSNVQ